MTKQLYDFPDDSLRSSRFAVSVQDGTAEVFATFCFGYARKTEYSIPGFWAMGDSPQLSFLTFGTDETVIVTVSRVSGSINTAEVHCIDPTLQWGVQDGNVVLVMKPRTKAWIVADGEVAEPVWVKAAELDDFELDEAEDLVFDPMVHTEVPAGKRMLFPVGVNTVGKQFKVNAGARAHVAGGGWVDGSFDYAEKDNVLIDGHGFLCGRFLSPEYVHSLSDFAEQMTYSLIYSYSATHRHTGCAVRGLTLVDPPFYATISAGNQCTDVSVIAPWFSNCDGIKAEPDYADSERCLVDNCMGWSGDDFLDASWWHYALTVTNCVMASSGSAVLLLGYEGSTPNAYPMVFRNNVAVAVAAYYSIPGTPGYEGGAIVQCWVDGADDESTNGRDNVTIDGLTVRASGGRIRCPVVNAKNRLYPWGSYKSATGHIAHWLLRNVVVDVVPDYRSMIWGRDLSNTPHDWQFHAWTFAGVPLLRSNWSTYFDANQWVYGLVVDDVAAPVDPGGEFPGGGTGGGDPGGGGTGGEPAAADWVSGLFRHPRFSETISYRGLSVRAVVERQAPSTVPGDYSRKDWPVVVSIPRHAGLGVLTVAQGDPVVLPIRRGGALVKTQVRTVISSGEFQHRLEVAP